MQFSFSGGIHPDYNKESTFASPVVEMAPPSEIVIPLSQHIGTPCKTLVSVGDYVRVGEKIADSDEAVSCPVHATVSGTVKAVEPRWHPSGSKVMSIVIKNDFEDEVAPGCAAVTDDIENLSPDQIISIAREAGIVGMGGAAFPLYVKLKTAIEKNIDTIIINGAECEPYITADHRAMVEYPRKIVEGVKLIMQCLDRKTAVIAIEENKPDAIATMKITTEDTGIQVVPLQTKYPQGGEKQLIKAVTGREIPPGRLPMDIGCGVFNVDTCASLCRAVKKGQPLIKRIVTVSGSAVVTPKNLLVRVGTKYKDVFDFCGDFYEDPYKIICGGPMMGIAQHSLETPIIKSTSALLAFCSDEESFESESVCIRCGRCIRACPMRLMPSYINLYASAGEFNECKKLNVQDCIECGCCSYVCPAKLYLVQNMRMVKEKLRREG
ncbi:MAG: electron transport complex subunit RsxC [Clostridiales bacterium]|nr:MAG: electron transport complex subunit RsxC [Clostridiales bacterium]